jgi:hypothetical protein
VALQAEEAAGASMRAGEGGGGGAPGGGGRRVAGGRPRGRVRSSSPWPSRRRLVPVALQAEEAAGESKRGGERGDGGALGGGGQRRIAGGGPRVPMVGRRSSGRRIAGGLGENEERGGGLGVGRGARGASYSALRDEVSPGDLRSSIRASHPGLAESPFPCELGSAETDRAGLPINGWSV